MRNLYIMESMNIKLLLRVIIFFIIFTVQNALGDCSSASYKIAFIPNGKSPFIKITAKFSCEFEKTEKIYLPSKWADGNYSSQVKNISFSDPSIKFITYSKNDEHYLIATGFQKKENLEMSYDLIQDPKIMIDVYNIIIKKDLVHSPGYGLFAYPDISYNNDLKIAIEWENTPSFWKTNSSNGHEKKIEFTGGLQRLLHAFYAAGVMRKYQISEENEPVYISLYGKLGHKDKQITEDIAKIIRAQRDFFNDHEFPYYAMSIIEGGSQSSYGGTALYNSFAAYFPRWVKRLDYRILLSHEHFHNWTGGKIKKSEERLNYWWSEGFTEYYSRVLDLRSDAISFDEFILECNKFLKEYYLSKAISSGNSRIEKDFWSNFDIQRLPYTRGFVYAIYLNDLIQKNNPEASLDNVMLDLFKESKDKKFSNVLFEKILKKYIPEGVDEDFNNYIEEGKIINLASAANTLGAKSEKMGVFELGFDLDELKTNKRIKNLQENSNAHKAGLKEGQKVFGFKFDKWFPDSQVTVQTSDKIIKFYPESHKKRDLYLFKQNLNLGDKEKIKRFFGCNASKINLITNINN
jgi:predicted metalloprotease with PDZ domain